MRKTYGFAPLGAADGAALANDKVVYWKSLYDKHGGGRTNLAYGYVTRGYAPAGA